ncbi:iron complex transport system substrate-binding protein [Paracoccus isoporae]|uniref:Iron complex transport system substrate-binding protein n=1 Tax=Paracoccus isoporae TaxID=591205 RepID=A0A1G6TVR7_9RHOB|nr:siderophore ABC transporter substrate-binding protein [Paracoccus isoporae]SDD33272.1 iron complex transport system substrate-binding protein [Paracoccus isoporae]
MRRISALVLAAASLATAAGAQDVTIATAQGEATVPASPEIVVAYDVAAIDTLQSLGVELAGVPDNLYIPSLSADGAETVGTLFEPDLEKLAGIGPDLVVVGARSAPALNAVSQLAPAIDMTIGSELLEDAKARIAAFGTIFDRQQQAEALTATLDDKIAALGDAAADSGTALILMTNGTKMAAYGPGSRFGWLHDVTKMPPAIPELAATENHGNVLTHEAIAEADPDWLFVLDRGAAIGEDGQSAAQTLASPLIEGTTAWQNDQVVYLPAAELYIGGGGYSSLVTVIDALTEAFGA